MQRLYTVSDRWMSVENWWKDNWQAKTIVLGGSSCPSATLLTVSPKWACWGLSQGPSSEGPVTDFINHSLAPLLLILRYFYKEMTTVFTFYLSVPPENLVIKVGNYIPEWFSSLHKWGTVCKKFYLQRAIHWFYEMWCHTCVWRFCPLQCDTYRSVQ